MCNETILGSGACVVAHHMFLFFLSFFFSQVNADRKMYKNYLRKAESEEISALKVREEGGSGADGRGGIRAQIVSSLRFCCGVGGMGGT